MAFAGPCRTDLSRLVDQEDVRYNPIASERMLHLICEDFSSDLEGAVWRQRMLGDRARAPASGAKRVRRDGDDLWDGTSKLSVSIAT